MIEWIRLLGAHKSETSSTHHTTRKGAKNELYWRQVFTGREELWRTLKEKVGEQVGVARVREVLGMLVDWEATEEEQEMRFA